MKILDLFSGTHSVQRAIDSDIMFHGWEVTSLDLSMSDINCDIMEWDYKSAFEPGHFDIIWQSPVCVHFSRLKRINIGRNNKNGKQVTAESIEADISNIGVPMLNKCWEIIDYFKPKYFFLENPATARTKDYIDPSIPFFTVDYCMYGFLHRKRTNVWTNLKDFQPRLCDKKCPGFVDGKHIQKVNTLGGGGDSTICGKRAIRSKVPEELISELFKGVIRETLKAYEEKYS